MGDTVDINRFSLIIDGIQNTIWPNNLAISVFPSGKLLTFMPPRLIPQPQYFFVHMLLVLAIQFP